ncbi:UDP-N-acetyl-D-mannosamine dehydrogenase [Seongchinamella unica]|uniref:UDP-N-acetyl-D-mannosamine dehydrogenase n=1 Tax=Seongchinamella unica TaxID=2547392 RepID=A0A4R5LQV2_9GAMM|nr:UDP-N-acetyl-D-mannosamine dehydrogenase [Seongchinamella unica]TDG12875.1 UDP-N-acetyl-D-mannosamine dehydrogenase [Seongchinamella unica]
MTKIAVIGLGYIGLPTATVLALRGFDVLGVDISQKVVDTLKEGKIHIVEPDLDVSVAAATKSGALQVSTQAGPADVFIIAVPTPFKNGKTPNLDYVEAAARDIAVHLQPGNLVILESTSPVGTTLKVSEWIAEKRSDLELPHQNPTQPDINVSHCPERVLPGRIMTELVENDRIIGGISPTCTEKTIDLYQQFVRGQCLPTDAATAEMAKLTENAFRDVNIAFANELSLLADKQGVNVWELIKLANHHPRVNILSPGPGVGGHCIAVDPWFLVDADPEQANLIRTAREVNDLKPAFIIEKVKQAIAGKDKPTIACLGLAFKANVDDLRESPALDICQVIAQIEGVNIAAVEPHIKELPESLSQYANVRLEVPEAAIRAADILVLLVDHRQFRDIPSLFDLSSIEIIDTRGQWE